MAGLEPAHDGVKVRCLTDLATSQNIKSKKSGTNKPQNHIIKRAVLLRKSIMRRALKEKMGWMTGFEPATPRATIWCSNQLSHTHRIKLPKQKARCSSTGAPEGIRTPGLLLRRQLLYPAELQAQNGAGDGNRTHVTSLEGWNSTIELHPQT